VTGFSGQIAAAAPPPHPALRATFSPTRNVGEGRGLGSCD
jgi:hypothetical protein